LPTTTIEAESASLVSKVKNGLKMMTVVPWLYKHWPSSKVASLEKYIKALKEEKGLSRIGAVGFCYGGKFAVEFNAKGLVNATVACHPSFTSVGSYKELKAPILFNCAQTDDIFTESTRKQVEQILDTNKDAPAHDIKVFEK
jgi:dienelactone hydrolase